MKYLGNGVMNRVERAFKEVSRKIWQYVGDYKAVDDIEDSLNQLEESINELMAQNSDYIFQKVHLTKYLIQYYYLNKTLVELVCTLNY